MPKLAIYVPKKDMRQIEKWRKKINFSRVFMEALSREIEQQSRIADTGKDKVAAAAEHYRRKLTESSAYLSDLGYRLGVEQVMDCRLSPEEIRKLLVIQSEPSFDCDKRRQFQQLLSQEQKAIDNFAAEHGCHDDTHPAWRDAVYRGYVQGVAAGWKRVCEEMAGR